MSALASKPSRRAVASDETPTERGLRLVAAYIPSEALAAYLALLGLLVPATGTPTGQVEAVKWIAFTAGLVLAVALVFFGYKRGQDTAAVARRKRAYLIVFAIVAFLAYSVATPGGPWGGSFLGIAVTVWGAAIAIVLAAILPVLAATLGLRTPADSADPLAG
jgi:hypothetical protein